MSVQETKLKAIADAIREKEGSTGPIPAGDFAARILALPGGSGTEGFAVPLVVTVEQGAAVTAVQGDTTITGTSGAGGTVTLILTAPGEWTVTASLNGKQKETTVTVGNGYEAVLRMSSNLPEGVTLPEGYVELEYIDNPNLGYIYQCSAATSPFIFDIEVGEEVNGVLWGHANRLTYSSPYKQYTVYLKLESVESGISVQAHNFGKQATTVNGLNYSSIRAAIVVPAGRMKIEYNPASLLIVNGEEKTFSPSVTGTMNALPTASVFCSTYTSRTSVQSSATTTATLPINCKLYSMICGANKNYWAPCKNPEGAVGLYDTANNRFYPSSAADKPFVAGPIV